MSEPVGSLCLVLHAHLPYVRHPEYESFLEEDWLFEAVCETYIPLIRMMDGLLDDGVEFRLTLSLTPTLLSMFGDELLQQRCRAHVVMLLKLAGRELERLAGDDDFEPLARMYEQHYTDCLNLLDRCGGDLTREFRRLLDTGRLEVITCGATHGFLPLMATVPEAVRAQIRIAADHYEEVLGRRPQGIWLPECGYFPGHERYLAEAGIQYFFTEAHGVLFGDPRPRYGTFAPVLCPDWPVAAFGRDLESSKQVWSAHEGYPGDFDYREFYRDVGWDLDYNYVKPYLGGAGHRKNLGLKYYRITGSSPPIGLGDKEPYRPEWARHKAGEHAGNFMWCREQQMSHVGGQLGIQPLVVAPYDAELFGHWWWEGPMFLDALFRRLHFDQDRVRPITAPEYLREHPVLQKVQPEQSSWGYKGYAEFWLNPNNDWIYRHLHQAAEQMVSLAGQYATPSDSERRALNQCARELVLAQASDWAFILQTRTVVEYARKRTSEHLQRFARLAEMLVRGTIDEGFLGYCEWKDNIFPHLDYRVYTSLG